MKKSRPPWPVVCVALCALLTTAGSEQPPDREESPGTVYYVDDERGDDTNSGTAPGAPWRSLDQLNRTTFEPGDRILLRAGGSWEGQLWPKGSGTESHPIIIDSLGDGKRPRIAAGGEFRDAVRLVNQEYWEINNLEVTNYREGDDQLDPANQKRGVYVLAEDVGEIRHIHLKGLHIHHVNGLLEPNFPAKSNGGIYFEVLGKTTRTWFDSFLIDGCLIHDVDRTGISNKSSWWNRTIDDDMDWVPSLNIVIRNTVVERAAYNAMIVRCADGALVEHCVLKNNGIKGNGNALFIYLTDNTLVQYCEAYGTVYQEGTTDAAGFDSDGNNRGSVFQFNYSHDNGLGGLVMAVGDGPAPFNDGAVFRYNICENNRREGLRLSGCPTNVTIHNNVFYMDPSESGIRILFHKKWGGWPSNVSYYNNIFYNMSRGSRFVLGEADGIRFSHNAFFGEPAAGEPEDPYKIVEDPRFVNAGAGGIGIDTVGGYELLPDSPCIDAGVLLQRHGDADYWGNPVPTGARPDRGAHEFASNGR